MNTVYPDPAAIRARLDPRCASCSLHFFDTVDSTNTEARRGQYPPGTVLLANKQTGGRGRRGKDFFSPPGGIYVSAVVEPWAQDLERMTTAAGLAVIAAIRRVTGIAAEKRRVNDIYLRGLKICGILAEGISDVDTAQIKAVVLGAGLNVRTPPGGFPPALAGVAGALFKAEPHNFDQNRLAAAIIDALLLLA